MRWYAQAHVRVGLVVVQDRHPPTIGEATARIKAPPP
jgi:hypothetical protein